MTQRRYSVMYTVHASTTVQVAAESAEEAIALSNSMVHASVCHHCADIVQIDDIGDVVEVIDVEAGTVAWTPPEETP